MLWVTLWGRMQTSPFSFYIESLRALTVSKSLYHCGISAMWANRNDILVNRTVACVASVPVQSDRNSGRAYAY